MPNVVLQQRDLAILTEIGHSPACSRTHIADRFFNGSAEASKKRLQLLIQADLISRNDKSALGRSVLRITKNGAALIARRGLADSYRTQPVSRHMLRHELLLADCLSCITRSAEAKNWFTEVSVDENQISFELDCPTHNRRESVTPDAFVTIYGEQTEHFFLEIDRSTETQAHLVHLAEQYRSFHRSGAFRPGPAPECDTRHRMRVLFVMMSRKRLERTAALVHRFTGVRTLIWFCLAEDFVADPIDANWRCPIDFSESSPCPSLRLLF